jgi:hypothetical protein
MPLQLSDTQVVVMPRLRLLRHSCRNNGVLQETMQENQLFCRQEEEAGPLGEAEGDPFQGFALGGDAASCSRGGTITAGQNGGLYRS